MGPKKDRIIIFWYFSSFIALFSQKKGSYKKLPNKEDEEDGPEDEGSDS